MRYFTIFMTALILLGLAPRLSYATDWPKTAEAFIYDIGDEALNSIAKNQTDPDKARKAFATLFREAFDVPTIARFTLGRYWRQASKTQQEEYVGLLEETILDLYAKRLKDYAGTPFKINSSRLTSRDDAMVAMSITPEGSTQSIKLDWRVRQRDGAMKVIDVMVEGVSMSLTNRQEFSAIIQRGGGDIEALLVTMREKSLTE